MVEHLPLYEHGIVKTSYIVKVSYLMTFMMFLKKLTSSRPKGRIRAGSLSYRKMSTWIEPVKPVKPTYLRKEDI